MDRQHFIMLTAGVLFAAFVIGWIASWLVGRLTRAGGAEVDALGSLARELRDAEEARDAALAERDTARSALTESQTEIEELRAYIDQRLARGREGTP